MRILAIGDIHGCLSAFDTLLRFVEVKPDDQIITLGDYVDRGPDSGGVLDRLVELNATGQLISLRGNHEEMMIEMRNVLSDEVPFIHWEFLESSCRDYFETDTHFFVHGGVDWKLPLAKQSTKTLRWKKLIDQPPHISGKIMICGHTAQHCGVPLDLGHTVCIDTHAYGGGWLTCLDVKSGEIWQANENEETRRGRLGELK
jgi:serine/threonine protein phosphatase 1